MSEAADLVTCQDCGQAAPESEARARGWVPSKGRWSCDHCLSGRADVESERDRRPSSD